jgi:hypothetical protein
VASFNTTTQICLLNLYILPAHRSYTISYYSILYRSNGSVIEIAQARVPQKKSDSSSV